VAPSLFSNINNDNNYRIRENKKLTLAAVCLLDIIEQALKKLLLCYLDTAGIGQFPSNLAKVGLKMSHLLGQILLGALQHCHMAAHIRSIPSHIGLHGLTLNIVQQILAPSQKLLVRKLPDLILCQRAMSSWRFVDLVESVPVISGTEQEK